MLLKDMKWGILVLSFSGISLSWAQSFAFQRESEVGMVRLPKEEGNQPVLLTGVNPSLSPDGKQIAFTETDAEGNRFIAVGDALTGKSRRVAGIPGGNSYRPLWSPDGQILTFDHFVQNDWKVARVKVGGGEFQILEGLTRKVASHAWMPDGKTLLCQDLDGFFTVDVENWGKPLLKKLPTKDMVEGLSSDSSMAVSFDGKTALVTLQVMPETSNDYPTSGIFHLDLETGELLRWSAKGMDVADPSWLPNGQEYLFTKYGEQPEIHRAEAKAGAVSKRVLVQAVQPSVARNVR